MPSYIIDEVVVTGTRNETDIRHLPMTISVVGRQQIEKRYEPSLLPLLTEQVPGFFTTSRGIMGYGVSTGAAGGMGGSLLAFLNAKLKPGIQLMLETLDFSNKIKGADLIITGEGKADKQTLMGKVPSGILDKARKQKIPVILIAGSVENADDLHRAGFRGVYSINPPSITLEQAMQPEVARANISETVVEICRSF